MHAKVLFSITAASILGLALAAPAMLQASGDHAGGHEHKKGAGAHTHAFGFGQPAKDEKPDRTVEITAKDSMEFDPSQIEVQKGEIIRFVVKNTGQLHHSFTLGTDEWHREHEKSMRGVAPEELVSHMQDEPNGAVVPPGETRSLTWKFTRTGSVPLGCHVPGHYPAGMKGKIDVESG